jgi:(p)ppGpp synthase/HD superfamily hydrolase
MCDLLYVDAPKNRSSLPPGACASPLLSRAFEFAQEAHQGQKRKGDGTPVIDHPVAVAQILFEAGFGEEVVAAALLHDVVEDTDITGEEVADRFGGEVAALVDALTDDRAITDYNERKAAHRAKVERAGMPAAAIYAADKLANVRALRAAYRAQGEAVGRRFNAPLDVKIERWREDAEMLRCFRGEIPYLQNLDLELKGFRADRLRGGEGR